jgi:hypothetical protein
LNNICFSCQSNGQNEDLNAWAQIDARLEHMMALCKGPIDTQIKVDLLKSLGSAIHSLIDEKLALALKTPAENKKAAATPK